MFILYFYIPEISWQHLPVVSPLPLPPLPWRCPKSLRNTKKCLQHISSANFILELKCHKHPLTQTDTHTTAHHRTLTQTHTHALILTSK